MREEDSVTFLGLKDRTPIRAAIKEKSPLKIGPKGVPPVKGFGMKLNALGEENKAKKSRKTQVSEDSKKEKNKVKKIS